MKKYNSSRTLFSPPQNLPFKEGDERVECMVLRFLMLQREATHLLLITALPAATRGLSTPVSHCSNSGACLSFSYWFLSTQELLVQMNSCMTMNPLRVGIGRKLWIYSRAYTFLSYTLDKRQLKLWQRQVNINIFYIKLLCFRNLFLSYYNLNENVIILNI